MSQPRMAKDLSEYQDVFGQLIKMNLYTTLCSCFSLKDASSKSQIIGTLTKGLERVSASFPWLAAQAINKYGGEGNPRLSQIIPLHETCRLIVKDFSHDTAVPSMESLKKAKFPFSMLDGALLASLTGPPTNHEGEPAEVFFVQANFINGGLLLTFAGEHNAMDGQGLGQVIRNFSKACHNEPFTDEELLQGNRARDNVIPLLDPTTYKPGPELFHLLVKPSATSSPTSDISTSRSTWAYFHFSSSSLSKLKAIASSPSSNSGNYITTNDALSAFIWKFTSRIRFSRLPSETTSTFGRAVDVRSALLIPSTYLGNLSSHTYNTFTLSSILTASLASLASSLRLALNPSDLSYGIRSLATHISLTPDTSTISYGSNMDFSSDIFFSSWAKLPCYNFDFNLGLGPPESVRRPRHLAIEGLMYLMPMDRSGGIDAAICLSDEDLGKLKEDENFLEYAEWIG